MSRRTTTYEKDHPTPRVALGLAHITKPALVGARALVMFGGSTETAMSDETWVFKP